MVQNHSLRPVLIGSISSQLHASSKPDLDYILYTIKVYQVIYSSRTIRTNMATEKCCQMFSYLPLFMEGVATLAAGEVPGRKAWGQLKA